MHKFMQQGKRATIQGQLPIDANDRQRSFSQRKAKHFLRGNACRLEYENAGLLYKASPSIVAFPRITPGSLGAEVESQQFPYRRTSLLRLTFKLKPESNSGEGYLQLLRKI